MVALLFRLYDWSTFLHSRFRKIPGIKKGHHFRILSSEPGVVYVKERSDGAETKHELLRRDVTIDTEELPFVVEPAGLASKRQWYLYDKIREFCPPDDRDITCPLPSVPRPASRQCTPEPASRSPSPSPPGSPTPPTPKRQRVCGVCNQPGHNRRTCPGK